MKSLCFVITVCLSLVFAACDKSKDHFVPANTPPTPPPPPPLTRPQGSTVDTSFPFISDFIKENNGSVKFLTQSEAEKECARRGSRLPTIREFAKDAEKTGGMLIEETDYNQNKLPVGPRPGTYYKIVLGETETSFYYSHDNYRKLQSNLKHMAWSSSLYPYDGNREAYFFLSNGSTVDVDGIIDHYNRSSPSAGARCLVDKN